MFLCKDLCKDICYNTYISQMQTMIRRDHYPPLGWIEYKF